MILSKIEIQRALDEKRLVISPEPSPRRPTTNVKDDCPYQTSSVDLRLANQISYFKEGLPLDINLSRGNLAWQRFRLRMSCHIRYSAGVKARRRCLEKSSGDCYLMSSFNLLIPRPLLLPRRRRGEENLMNK